MFWILLALTLIQVAVTYGAASYVTKRGGNWLVLDDTFTGPDKPPHYSWSFIAAVLLAVPLWQHPVLYAWALAHVAYGVENIQLARLAEWIGSTRPRPANTHGISWRDLVVDLAGFVSAIGLLALLV